MNPLPVLVLLLWAILAGPAFGISSLDQLAEQAELHSGKSGAYILEMGEESLLARAWLTDSARKSIDVQYFIWSSDNVGTLSSEALLRAAERGVVVRIIVDDLLIDAEPETLLSLAAHPNVNIRIYNPQHSVGVSFWRRVWNLITDFRGANQRMHDKAVIFDRRAAITGGRNMADEYYDYDHRYNFRDRDVLLAGPVVAEMSKSFERFWRSPLSVPLAKLLADEQKRLTRQQAAAYARWLHEYAGKKENFAPEVRRALEGMAERFPVLVKEMRWGKIDFINDLPGKNSESTSLGGGGESTSSLVRLLKSAKRRVTIQTPYLVMPEGALELFSSLHGRGVEVRIVTNSLAATDNMQAYSGYHKQRQSLLGAGLRIFEFKPDPSVATELLKPSAETEKENPIFALHAKSLVVDGEVLFIGTFNLDPRSANLNTEVGVLIHDEKLARRVEADIERDMAPENSWNPAVDEPDSQVSWTKRIKLFFWKLFPLEPLL